MSRGITYSSINMNGGSLESRGGSISGDRGTSIGIDYGSVTLNGGVVKAFGGKVTAGTTVGIMTGGSSLGGSIDMKINAGTLIATAGENKDADGEKYAIQYWSTTITPPDEYWWRTAETDDYTNGAETAFAPNATTTRGMFVTILYRLEGEPAANDAGFTDVENGAWYQAAVDWAAANGIVNGTSETTFDPNGTLTREQMAAILYRYAAYKGYDVSQKAQLDQFQDQSTVSGYAEDALSWANAVGLITGVTDTTLSPKGSAVRAQAATILMRFCESVVK